MVEAQAIKLLFGVFHAFSITELLLFSTFDHMELDSKISAQVGLQITRGP